MTQNLPATGKTNHPTLSSRIKSLEESTSLWKIVKFTLVGLATLLAALGFVADAYHDSLASALSKALTEREKNASEANALAIAKANTDSEVARTEAAVANSRASANEREAAGLREMAEKERLARVEIERKMAARVISDAERQSIGEKLKQFAPTLSKRVIKVSSYALDAEGGVFAAQIVDILARAEIKYEPAIGRLVSVGFAEIGIRITGPSADGEFIRVFSEGIQEHLPTRISGEWNPKYAELEILVGVKPVPGLPEMRFRQ